MAYFFIKFRGVVVGIADFLARTYSALCRFFGFFNVPPLIWVSFLALCVLFGIAKLAGLA